MTRWIALAGLAMSGLWLTGCTSVRSHFSTDATDKIFAGRSVAIDARLNVLGLNTFQSDEKNFAATLEGKAIDQLRARGFRPVPLAKSDALEGDPNFGLQGDPIEWARFKNVSLLLKLTADGYETDLSDDGINVRTVRLDIFFVANRQPVGTILIKYPTKADEEDEEKVITIEKAMQDLYRAWDNGVPHDNQ